MRLSQLADNHILIGGQTGSGKTYFANWLAKSLSNRYKVIFVNPQHEPKPFYTTSELNAKDLLEHDVINFEIVNPGDIKKAIKYALALGKNGIQTYLFIDEAHLFDKYQEIELIPRLGRKWRVFQVTISQRLNDVASKHRAVITQSRYVILFSLSRFEAGLLRYYGLQDLRVNLEKYHFLIFDTATDKYQIFKPIR